MPSITRIITLRPPSSAHHFLHTSTRASASILFQLQGLSNSREGQWLSKASGLPRHEYSAALQLIKSSEVDPFTRRAAAAATSKKPNEHVVAAGRRNCTSGATTLSRLDANALSIGRSVMAQHRREVQGLQRRLGRLARATRQEGEAASRENRRLRRENVGATVGMVVAVAVATGVASWRFTGARPAAGVDGGEAGGLATVFTGVGVLGEGIPLTSDVGATPVESAPFDDGLHVTTASTYAHEALPSETPRWSWFWNQ